MIEKYLILAAFVGFKALIDEMLLPLKKDESKAQIVGRLLEVYLSNFTLFPLYLLIAVIQFFRLWKQRSVYDKILFGLVITVLSLWVLIWVDRLSFLGYIFFYLTCILYLIVDFIRPKQTIESNSLPKMKNPIPPPKKIEP